MTCRRNLVMQDLVACYQARLQAFFSPGGEVTRDLERNPGSVAAQLTPSASLVEGTSELSASSEVDGREANDFFFDNVEAVLHVVIRSTTERAGIPQDLINEVITQLDFETCDTAHQVSGVPYAVSPLAGRSGVVGEGGVGGIRYPIIVAFARETLLDVNRGVT